MSQPVRVQIPGAKSVTITLPRVPTFGEAINLGSAGVRPVTAVEFQLNVAPKVTVGPALKPTGTVRPGGMHSK